MTYTDIPSSHARRAETPSRLTTAQLISKMGEQTPEMPIRDRYFFFRRVVGQIESGILTPDDDREYCATAFDFYAEACVDWALDTQALNFKTYFTAKAREYHERATTLWGRNNSPRLTEKISQLAVA